MDKKIIFFDVDGTLFCPEIGYITQNVQEAIAYVQKLGHLCFIASGRPYGYIAENVKELHFDGYVLANGANVKYQNQDLQVRYMNQDHVRELCKNLKQKHIEYVLQTTNLCYMPQTNQCLLEFYSKCNIDFHNFCFEYKEEDIIPQTVKMEVWAKDDDELQTAISYFHHFAYELHPDQHSLEIYAREVSKATGILDVLQELSIPLENSYCFGDGPNDVEMFETVAHPIAMGNALDIIKERAQEICPSVQEDGVAKKLYELFSNK